MCPISGDMAELKIAPSGPSSDEWIASRIEIFDRLKAAEDAKLAAAPREPIEITLADGKVISGTLYETLPLEIARSIGKSFFERQVVAEVDGVLEDLDRPLTKSCQLVFHDFELPKGQQVFWHSSAHVLGEACECTLGGKLVFGPPTEEGFFYDFAAENPVAAADYAKLEAAAKKAVSEKQPFVRLTMTKAELMEMFLYNKYKQHLVDTKIPDGTSTTVYRCGPLIDLCRGPHVQHTGRIKAFKVLKNSALYFLGDAKNDSLQRVYGIAFPDKKRLDAHLKFLKEAAERDHRKIGKEQDLFFFDEMSPGSAFWLPHGARIYNTLVEFMRLQYKIRGFEEVITPNMYNLRLWETLGHWANYKDDMFVFDVEKDKFGLKPMNCPGHCMLFALRERLYRELPWRVADFGVLHRNEASGALSGLTRVRRFQQDDAHIFCTEAQIGQEIKGALDFLTYVYGVFGFDFKMGLSTRPEKFVGDIALWDEAERVLAEALDLTGKPWTVNEADGAFYGPKIDIMILDALRRQFQCATIQLDFQLPRRFKLEYRENEGAAHPVMIHRAILGSVERMTAILTEHYAGKWPFWLSPRQVLVVPVGPKYYDYAEKVKEQFKQAGFYADADVSGNTLQKKVRTGQVMKYNFVCIVGEEEEKAGTVNVRNRDVIALQGKTEMVAVETVIGQMKLLLEEKRDDNVLA